jgi:hypothetical protein
MVRRGQLSNTELEWYTVEERLEEIRAELDPVWVEVFDMPNIENCTGAFRFQCPRRWAQLKVTGDPTVRHCAACEKKVHYCHTLEDAQSHARQGHCVAVRLGVLRYPDDLKPPLVLVGEVDEIEMGDFDPEYFPGPEPRRPWWKFW